MKIKDLIAKLETCEELYGNIDVVIAADSEGNSFSTIDDNILHSKVYANEADFLRAGYRGQLTGGAYPEVVEKFYKNAKVIGICLYPYEEDFEYAEDAISFRSEPKKS